MPIPQAPLELSTPVNTVSQNDSVSFPQPLNPESTIISSQPYSPSSYPQPLQFSQQTSSPTSYPQPVVITPQPVEITQSNISSYPQPIEIAPQPLEVTPQSNAASSYPQPIEVSPQSNAASSYPQPLEVSPQSNVPSSYPQPIEVSPQSNAASAYPQPLEVSPQRNESFSQYQQSTSNTVTMNQPTPVTLSSSRSQPQPAKLVNPAHMSSPSYPSYSGQTPTLLRSVAPNPSSRLSLNSQRSLYASDTSRRRDSSRFTSVPTLVYISQAQRYNTMSPSLSSTKGNKGNVVMLNTNKYQMEKPVNNTIPKKTADCMVIDDPESALMEEEKASHRF